MNIIIRSAEEKDLDNIIDYQIQMALETEEIHLDRATLVEGVRTAFSDIRKGRYFMADFDNEAVGSFLITYEWSDWRNGNILWMQSVFVEKEYRKIGVFKEMYKHLLIMVESDDQLKGIRLYVDKTNTTAQKAYERMGMENHHYEMYEWMK